MIKTTGTVVFDIIGTCFSLDLPRQRLVELGAPDYTVQLWFAQTLRDAFALSHAGGYRPLKEVLEAELPRTLKMIGIEASSVELPLRGNLLRGVGAAAWCPGSFPNPSRGGLEVGRPHQRERGVHT